MVNKFITSDRKRWGKIMLPLTILSLTVCLISSWLAGSLLYLAAVMLPVLLWARLRYSTPKQGIRTRTIEGDHNTIVLLSWLAFCLIVVFTLFAMDYYILGHPSTAPAEPYQWFVFVAFFVVLISGCSMIDRRGKSSNDEEVTLPNAPSNCIEQEP